MTHKRYSVFLFCILALLNTILLGSPTKNQKIIYSVLNNIYQDIRSIKKEYSALKHLKNNVIKENKIIYLYKANYCESPDKKGGFYYSKRKGLVFELRVYFNGASKKNLEHSPSSKFIDILYPNNIRVQVLIDSKNYKLVLALESIIRHRSRNLVNILN